MALGTLRGRLHNLDEIISIPEDELTGILFLKSVFLNSAFYSFISSSFRLFIF